VAEPLRSLLNARYSFVAPAAMNAIMNTVAATAVIVLGGAHIVAVAWAYLLGAAAQLVFIAVLAVRRGFRLHRGFSLRAPDVVSTARLSGRPIVSAALNPAARVGEQVIASFLPSGSISILSYGMTLVNAIGGTVFFRSVMVAVLPRLTEAHAKRDSRRFTATARLGLDIMLAVSVPLAVYMAVLADPAARALFHRGKFGGASAVLLGGLLAVYSVSLVGSAVQRALLAPFFARLDTRTPLRNTVYGVVANLVLLPICILPWGFHNRAAILGVALAYSLAQYVNVVHAAFRLRSTLEFPIGIPIRWILTLVAAGIAGAATMLGLSVRAGLSSTQGRWELLAQTAAVGIVGGAVMAAVFALLGGHKLRRDVAELRRKPARPKRSEQAESTPRLAEESSAH
jgi:peptidoglycan biosynthesis protein MviN/MurJ (putative lipid II flippase)